MPTTALTVTEIASRYPTAGTEYAMEAGDVANGNHYVSTGREILLVENTSEDTAFDLTITSTADDLGRLGNLVEAIPFGEKRALFLAIKGWRDDDRTVALQVEDATVLLAVLRLPT